MEKEIIKINRIGEVLDSKGMSQRELARKMNKSYNSINEICLNKRQPRLQDFPKLSEILDVPMNELIVAEKIKK